MYDPYAAAKATKRVERRNQSELRAAYNYLLAEPYGRFFLSSLIARCKLFEPVSSPEDEGARRVAVMLRNDIEGFGLIEKWQKAEREYAAYQEEIRHMLETTEAKEEN